jgi:3-hydroxyanthranilate 3,4-dioxygenase
MLHTFKEGKSAGPYDEYPVLTADVDPQLHLSRNDRPQPFFLVCEKDTVIVQMSGKCKVELRQSSVLSWSAVPGDFLYIPGGTPHRIVPQDVCVQYRFKALASGKEGVAWYCAQCDRQVRSDIWNTVVELPQEGYLRAVRAFNASPTARTCPACGHGHPEIDLSAYRWAEIAQELRAEADPAE